jgi:tetratricopeptide (TPR) repeat protein
LIIACILIPAIAFSQAKKIDNSFGHLPALKDSALTDSLNQLSFLHIVNLDRDSAQYFERLAMEEAKRLHYVHGMAVALSNQARILQHFDNDFSSSENLAKKAIALFERTNDKRGMEQAYEVLLFSVFSESKFEEAYNGYRRIYLISRANGDSSGQYEGLSGIGLVHLQEGNYDSAFIYMKQAQVIALRMKSDKESQYILFLFGELYRGIGDYKGAMNFYREAFRLDKPAYIKARIDEDWETWLRMEYAELFSLQGQFDSACHYFGNFDNLRAEERDLRVYLISTGEMYLLKGEYARALSNFHRGLAIHRKLNDRNEIKRTLLDLAKAYYYLGNNGWAMKYAQEGIDMAMRTNSNQFIRDGYEIMYSVYDRLHQTDSAYRYYKLFNEKKSIILNDQTKGRMAAFDYERKIDSLDNEQLINQQQLNFQQQKLKSEAGIRNILIVCLGAILTLGVFIYRNIALRGKNERLRSERYQSELRLKAADLEMQALRTQMNPHFIFNCLNSINRFILKNETQDASDYLTKFSRLIRMVLVNSKNKLISLEDELNMLTLYLDMERLRFKNSFSYKIISESIDAENVFVPPMLLQPFAENAIWHGLLNKGEAGQLEIEICREGDNILLCKIMDDGIGREAAAKIKDKSAENQKSMGLKITKERLDLVNGNEGRQTYFEVEDLFDSDGKAAGTSVALRIKIE